jgi:hypothetical protein
LNAPCEKKYWNCKITQTSAPKSRKLRHLNHTNFGTSKLSQIGRKKGAN